MRWPGGLEGFLRIGEPDYNTRFGFSLELAQKSTTPYPKEYFMAAELQPGALDECGTSVRYAAPFDAFDAT
ncbi:MAG: hypothetical protein ACR2OR_13845 [Hyphomicrobiales bacterium]